MKRISTLMLLLSAWALVGCSDSESEQQQPPIATPSLQVEACEPIPYFGGSFSLAYTIENPIEGEEIEVSDPQDSWIKNVEVSAQAICFEVEPYDVEQGALARATTLEVTYADLTPVEISITQSAPSELFTVQITRATPDTVFFTVAPKNNEITYFCNRTTESGLEKAGSLEACVMENVLALSNDDFYGDMLDDYLYVGRQELAFTYNEIPSTKHYLYVAPIRRANDEKRTPSLQDKPVILEVILPPYPTLSITPTEAEPFSIEAGVCTFRYAVEQPLEGVKVIAEPSEATTWIGEIEVKEDGTITFDYPANPHPIARQGEIIVQYDYAEWCYFSFSQEANEEQEQVTFDLTVQETHYNCVVVNCTPSDPEARYALGAISKAEFDKYPCYGDAEKLPELLNRTSTSYEKPEILTGEQLNHTINGLYTGGGLNLEWVVYVFAVNEKGNAATSKVKCLVATLVEDAPQLAWDDAQIKYNALTIPATGGTYTVKYRVSNPLKDGVLKIGEIYESTNNGFLEKNPDGGYLTHDAEACTITFTATANASGKSRSLYLSLAYYASAEDTFSEDNLSLSLTQSK
ncbi:MAG: hypothetical protein IJX56_04200 [Alistipes sp.]|nr:hypothetical protein [Alistipes sp.]